MIPTYKVIDELGKGGMGVVFRAIHHDLKREVALKVMLPHAETDRDFVTRFRREAETMAALRHPNIIQILDFGSVDGKLYYAMELLEARDLETIRRQETLLVPRRAIGLLAQAADALVYLHEQGIIHRDIKPENMMVDANDHLTIMDFGLVKVSGRTVLTAEGQCLGTPRYMPPELLLSPDDATSPAADMYSLGLTFWQLLAGRPAFLGKSRMDLVQWIITTGPGRLREVATEVPTWLTALIERMCARDPATRPSAKEVRELCRSGGSTEKAPVRTTRPARRVTGKAAVSAPRPVLVEDVRARRWPGAMVGGCLVVAVVGVCLGLRPGPRPAVRAAPASAASSPADSAALATAAHPALPEPVPVIHELKVYPTDVGVLIDYERYGPGRLEVEIAERPGGPALRRAPHPPETRILRRAFHGLAPSHTYYLRIRTESGQTVLQELEFQTHRSAHGEGITWLLPRMQQPLSSWQLYAADYRLKPDMRLLNGLLAHVKNPPIPLTDQDISQAANLLSRINAPEAADWMFERLGKSVSQDETWRRLFAGLAGTRDGRTLEVARRRLANPATLSDRYVILTEMDRLSGPEVFRFVLEQAAAFPVVSRAGFGSVLVHADRVQASELARARLAEQQRPASRADSALAIELCRWLADAPAVAALEPYLDPARAGLAHMAAVDALTPMPRREVRHALAQALIAHPDSLPLLRAAGLAGLVEGLPALLAALAPGKPSATREVAALALGQLGLAVGGPHAAAVQALVRLLDETDPVLRDCGAWALGHWRDPAARAALRKFAASPRDAMGRGALALARLDDREAAPALAHQLETLAAAADGAPGHRRALLCLALGSLGHQPARAAMKAAAMPANHQTQLRWSARIAMDLLDSPAPAGTRIVWIDPISPVERTGIRLRPGEHASLRVRGWSHVDGMSTEKGLGPILRHGPVRMLAGELWHHHIAEHDAELMVLTERDSNEDEPWLPLLAASRASGVAMMELRVLASPRD